MSCPSNVLERIPITGCGLQGQLGHSGGPVHLAAPRVVEELKGLRAFDEQSNAVVPLNVVDVAVGNNHSLALLSDGSVLTWGQNQAGQVTGAVWCFFVCFGTSAVFLFSVMGDVCQGWPAFLVLRIRQH